MVILLLSNKWDISIDYVVERLRKRNCDYVRLNTEDLPHSMSTVHFPSFTYSTANKKRLSEGLQSVLLRRPGKPFEFSKSKPHSAILKYISDQWHSFICGLESIPNVSWINARSNNNFAEIKINQLKLAESINFKIPKTCITNNKDDLMKFADSCTNQIIAKALDSPLIQDNDKEFFIFSNRITDFSKINNEEFSLAPTIFQEEINNKTDYRITIVGKSCFSAEISYNNKSVIDWRKIKDNIRLKPCSLPDDIVEKCIQYISKLGLVFGAIDVVKSNDEYYFLEINPNGEWGWLQNKGLNIAESIADHLIIGVGNE